MRYWIGTSGYNYPEWRGSFYPEKFPANKMLAYYAGHFNTVEVNYTFYRMPTEAQVENWANGTPDGFTFTLKAPQRITHVAKLRNCDELTQTFCRIASTLGPKLAVLLFQLPPTFKRNDAVFESFLQTLPHGARAAFEFRHESWHDEAVFAALRARNLALCIADSEKMSTPVVATADYSYFRLRDEGYQAPDIERWGSVVAGMSAAKDAFVYFKHEEEGKGPEFAKRLMDVLGTAR
jgi:uncharacterized protein YecE (DUF72 family)